jgi:hypothetical protein
LSPCPQVEWFADAQGVWAQAEERGELHPRCRQTPPLRLCACECCEFGGQSRSEVWCARLEGELAGTVRLRQVHPQLEQRVSPSADVPHRHPLYRDMVEVAIVPVFCCAEESGAVGERYQCVGCGRGGGG